MSLYKHVLFQSFTCNLQKNIVEKKKEKMDEEKEMIKEGKVEKEEDRENIFGRKRGKKKRNE